MCILCKSVNTLPVPYTVSHNSAVIVQCTLRYWGRVPYQYFQSINHKIYSSVSYRVLISLVSEKRDLVFYSYFKAILSSLWNCESVNVTVQHVHVRSCLSFESRYGTVCTVCTVCTVTLESVFMSDPFSKIIHSSHHTMEGYECLYFHIFFEIFI